MWVTGHLAFAYLLIIPFYLYKKKEMEPILILNIFIFANLIDAIHIGPLRLISHNLIGTSIFVAFWLLLFYKINVIKIGYVPILIIAVASHVVGDLLFSGYSLLYPFENQSYVIYGWNTPEHMIVGSLLVFAFLGLFLMNRDYSRLREFLHGEEQNFLHEFKFNKLFSSNFVTYYVFFAFRLFIIVQLGLFIFSNITGLSNWIWYTWACLASFVLCAITFSMLTFKPKKLNL
ncbi:MAG: hypothetical protein Q7J68_05765 [Thermoplasmata archaeon]|nr:hypothetical protein [Thermoplasmata archaeon]